MEQQWLTIAEVAAALKVGEPTVEQLIERGMLEVEQHGDQPRVSQEALMAFLRADQHTLEVGQQPPDIAALPPNE